MFCLLFNEGQFDLLGRAGVPTATTKCGKPVGIQNSKYSVDVCTAVSIIPDLTSCRLKGLLS